MAFPLPQHLPRAGLGQESAGFGSTSSHAEPFLKKIALSTQKDLNGVTARRWLKGTLAMLSRHKAHRVQWPLGVAFGGVAVVYLTHTEPDGGAP